MRPGFAAHRFGPALQPGLQKDFVLVAGAVEPAMLTEMHPHIAFRKGQQAIDGLDGDVTAGGTNKRQVEFAVASADIVSLMATADEDLAVSCSVASSLNWPVIS